MRPNLLEFSTSGIHCPAGGFHIDPWKPVERALITHGHSDHARWGNGSYLATPLTCAIMRHRLGDGISTQEIPYGQKLLINGVTVSFHPAGHIPGSAQIRVESRDEVWVVSGDYKLCPDPLSEPFEPVPCHAFVSECTFGLPIFRWQTPSAVFAEINDWWQKIARQRASVLIAYSLGKAQRLMTGLNLSIGPAFVHGAIGKMNEALRAAGIDNLPQIAQITRDTDKSLLSGALILAPPSVIGSPWLNRFEPLSLAVASGWMAIRGNKRRRGIDRGFVLSDHADWRELNESIRLTGAEKIFVTHGYTAAFSRWLKEQCSLDAQIVQTEFSGETFEEKGAEDSASDPSPEAKP
ncbi:ligase-associated DNA damage response exonuclease [Oscillatoria laete-virens NRMC-F 0139]|nr:ligase-associated DNA damage response exonuclease [Oscillatoria laete-virens NRMC-F 0139]